MQFRKTILALLFSAGFLFAAAAQSLYPANGEKNAPYDTQIVITFDNEPELVPGSFVYIYHANGTVADKIAFTDETQTFADATQVAVGSQLVRKQGNSVYITPHNGAIAPESSYYVIIDNGAIKGTLENKPFEGFAANAWTFNTKAAPVNPADGGLLTVNNSSSTDNTATFHSINGAISSVSELTGTYTIEIAPGTYYELLHYNGKANIIMQGPKDNNRGDSVTIEYVNCNDMNGKQDTRPSFFFTGANLTLENITLINLTDRNKTYVSSMKYPSGNSQAETLFFAYGTGHTLTAYNSTFKSLQDTMQISGKCWFYNCAVDGDVDYVWGKADVALFEDCDFTCLYDKGSGKDRSYMFETRVGQKSNPLVGKGFVLFNSRVHVQKGQTAYYGRRATAKTKPTDYYDQCAIINTEFTGDGNVGDSRWYANKEPEFIGDASNVGWKEYNVSFKGITGKKPADTKGRYKNSADISKKEYKAEFSNRDAIINRVYNLDKNKYEADTTNPWDVNQIARERGYKVKNLPKGKK